MNKEDVRTIQKRLDELVDMMNVKWRLYNQYFEENGLGDIRGHFERNTYEGMCQSIICLGGFWGRGVRGNHIVSVFNVTSVGSVPKDEKITIAASGKGKNM